jgi:hypothetical protein
VRERDKSRRPEPSAGHLDRKYYPALGVDPALGRRMQWVLYWQTGMKATYFSRNEESPSYSDTESERLFFE